MLPCIHELSEWCPTLLVDSGITEIGASVPEHREVLGARGIVKILRLSIGHVYSYTDVVSIGLTDWGYMVSCLVECGD